MKKLLSWIGISACLGILAVSGWNFYHFPKPALISPVLGVSKVRYSDNVWFPQEASASSFPDAPEITAQSAFFVEANTGKVLYQKDPKLRLPIASITKIMTAILALENKDPQDTYTVTKHAADMEPDKMFLKEGEKLSLEELLDGIFLVSGNDAAELLAEQTTFGGREEFINLMNTKAKVLGMNDTLFINPTGLEEDEVGSDPTQNNSSLGSDPQQVKRKNRYSTAYDVALMSRYLIARWPEITEISSNPHIYLPQTATHQEYDLYSGINLLTTYPGVLGLKIGFTPEAGLTLVTLAKRGDSEVIGVLLGSTERRDDAKAMLDYSFQKLGIEPQN